MATYGFLEQFVESVISGRKTQTIRNVRKHAPRVGELLRLKCKGVLFGTALITEVFEITFVIGTTGSWRFEPKMQGEDLEAFAARDGLSVEDLIKFLRRYAKHKHGWNKFLVIRWEDFKKIQKEKGLF